MMRKEYIRPITDVVESQLSEHLLEHSYDWADSKGYGGWDNDDNTVITNGQYGNGSGQGIRNLWDD